MEQNHNMLRGISENGGIVFYGVDSTEIVREMERLHKTSAVTTAALGRLLTAASMMGIMLKSTQDSVTLQIKGGGPAGRLLAVSDGTGNVKGYVFQKFVRPVMAVSSVPVPTPMNLLVLLKMKWKMVKSGKFVMIITFNF